MGQARLRGTFEVRCLEGAARREAERAEAKRLIDERERAKTPLQRAKEREARMLIAVVLGIMGGSEIVEGEGPW